jgi:hypothetical protein
MLYGSKHGGVEIYFVIYLEKIRNKVIPKFFWGKKVVRTS